MKWEQRDGRYLCTAHLVDGIVLRNDDIAAWNAVVTVRGAVVHRSEHASRDDGIAAAEHALYRACRLRRFEDDPPLTRQGEPQ